jgi:hypothetical protein
MNAKSHRILTVMETVQGKYITSALDAKLMEEFNRLIVHAGMRENIREPHARTNRREGRLLVLTGPSGAGKTRSLIRTIRRHPALEGRDPEAPDSPVTIVTVTSPCTLKQLGRDTLHNTGYPLQRDLREHQTWELVRNQLDLGSKVVLVYDEMQHITQAANVAEQQKVANTIKDLMINRQWRLSIIVCGLPSVAEFIRSDKQLERRARFLEMKPLRMPADNADIAAMVAALAGFADLCVDDDVETNLAPRLIHAAGNLFGIAIEITHEAIVTALDPDYLNLGRDEIHERSDHDARSVTPGSNRLTREHFARALEGRLGCTDDENPFVSRDWVSTLAPTPAPAPSARNRKRLAKPTNREDAR